MYSALLKTEQVPFYNSRMDALAFLEQPPKGAPGSVYVVFGDEAFLKRQVLEALREQILGEGDEGFALARYSGDSAAYAEVIADVETVPFLAPRRLVIVDGADAFVSKYRGYLEKFVAKPSTTGTLVLEVKSWPSNTRLAKLLDVNATLVCKSLTGQQLPGWCVRRFKQQHGKVLTQQAARLLIDLVGNELGMLDQELAKLASYAGEGKQVDFDDVDKLVGRSRMADTFKIFELIATANSADALRMLDRLFDQGEDALRILGAFSYELRRLARAVRLQQLGRPLYGALQEVGYPPFAVARAEQLLRHLGRRRADSLLDWLLAADQGMKGGSALTPRQILERFVVLLARAPEATTV
jgi:DNA polymerase III subunit delta